MGSLICLSCANFFSTSEPEYAYKRYAYQNKNMYGMVNIIVVQDRLYMEYSIVFSDIQNLQLLCINEVV